MKAVVAAFNQEEALVGAFSVITNLQMDLRFKLYWGLLGAEYQTGGRCVCGRRLRQDRGCTAAGPGPGAPYNYSFGVQ